MCQDQMMFQRAKQACGAVGLVLKVCRKLHIHLSTGQSLSKIENEATHLSVGVGFVVAYAPNKSSGVWVQPFDTQSNLFGELGCWHHLLIPAPVRQVVCGRSHLVALTTEDKVYTAGLSIFGQCGNSSRANHGGKSLSRVCGLAEKIHQVACGLDHTLFLTEEGHVFSCGWSADGQTGTDNYSSVTSPGPVHLPRHLSFSSIYTGADTSFAYTCTGQLYGWGSNEYGQLGVLSTDQQVSNPVHVEVPNLDTDGPLVSMATGGAFTAFLTDAGSVYVVGYSIGNPSLSHNQEGELLHPGILCSLKKLHDGQSSDFIHGIHAGLHYLVGEVSPREMIVWGRYPDATRSEHMSVKSVTKITLDCGVESIAYGPTSIAAVFNDNVTEPISSLS